MADAVLVNGIRPEEGPIDSNPRAGPKAGAIKHNRKCMQLGCYLGRCSAVSAPVAKGYDGTN